MLKRWKDISIAGKLYLVIGAMAVLIAGELATLNFAMHTLSAVRAFVGGEGLWSKGQKNAAFHFQRFVSTHEQEDFDAFLTFLKIPEGDHQARVELMKRRPDMDVVRAGFTQGKIHPDDIDPMVRLLQRFYWEPHLSRAIKIWADADGLLGQFRQAGWNYYHLVKSPRPDQDAMRAELSRIRTLNEELTVIEEEFSNVLGEGSRWLERAVISLLFLAVLTVESVSLTLTILTSRSISRGLSEINSAAVRIGRGQFTKPLVVDSRDEIGTLAGSINDMGALLERSYRDLEVRVHERTSELTALAAENARLLRQAEEAVRMRDEFISIASHEFRTPLTALSMQLQLLPLQTEALDRKGVEELASSLARQVKRLMVLSEELMDLTHLRAGKFELRLERCDLAAIAMEVGNQLNVEATRAGGGIRVSAESPVVGRFDPVRMSQVVTNLVSNAIKYGDGKPIHVEVTELGGEACLRVRDQGKGIPLELQARIFDRFERGGADQRIPGLGLGLYITRQIVLAHQGRISVESTAGQGSSFIVHLPLGA